MHNAKTKDVNMDKLSSGDIFALFDSVESDDEGDSENIMNDTSGQDEPNSAPATHRTCCQSPVAVTKRTTDQSPTAVVTGYTSVQPSNSTPTPTVSLPKITKKPNQSLLIKDKTKKKKVNCSSIENNTNQTRDSIPQDEDKTSKKKTNTTKK